MTETAFKNPTNFLLQYAVKDALYLRSHWGLPSQKSCRISASTFWPGPRLPHCTSMETNQPVKGLLKFSVYLISNTGVWSRGGGGVQAPFWRSLARLPLTTMLEQDFHLYCHVGQTPTVSSNWTKCISAKSQSNYSLLFFREHLNLGAKSIAQLVECWHNVTGCELHISEIDRVVKSSKPSSVTRTEGQPGL